MMEKVLMRPRSAINTRLDELKGYTPESFKSSIPPWGRWRCHVCGWKGSASEREPKIIMRGRDEFYITPTGEAERIKTIDTYSHFLCAECFKEFQNKFENELVAARLAGMGGD